MEIEIIRSLLSSDVSKENYASSLELIKYLSEKYYNESISLISDLEFDIFFKKVEQYESQNNLFNLLSQTKSVGAKPTKETLNNKHLVPMISLSNSYNSDDLIEFDKSINKELNVNDITYFVEPKFDGSSISIIYEANKLIKATTRGDGIVGEDITNNSFFLKGIPKEVFFDTIGIKKVELRGEVVISKEDFESLNVERENEGLSLFQNSRNTASGSLRLKDAEEMSKRKLQVFIYGIGYIDFIDDNSTFFTKHSDILKKIASLGFSTSYKYGKICQSIEDVQSICNDWQTKKDTFDIDIDGMVIKLNNINYQLMMGTTSHHPKWAKAYKFKAIQKVSKLIDIEFQIGRTGIITPVAKIEPLELSGVTIRSISLHNEDYINIKDIRINDFVYIERAGEVIPQIVSVDLTKRENQTKFIYTTKCPSCENTLIQREGEVAWRCTYEDCKGKKLEKILYFVSKEAMNIKGLGKDIVKRFVELNIISNFESIYNIDYQYVLSLEGWKSQSVENLKRSIEESKNNEMYRLLVAFGIENVGVSMSKTLAKKVNNIEDFYNFEVSDFIDINEIGAKMADSLYRFFSNAENRSIITNFKNLGINTKSKQSINGDKFKNEIFVFTGFRDAILEKKIESLGGEVSNSFSKKTTFLVVKNKGTGSTKEKKALENKIKIIDINDLIKILEN